jgi:hypothetical protein
MNRTILLVIALAAPAVGCAAKPTPAAPSSASAAPLDGTAYRVSLEFPGEAPVEDTLRFDAGRFESTACTSLGFPRWTEYRAEPAGAAIAFHVVTHDPRGPEVQWDGTIERGVASGQAKRTLEGKTDLGTFRGQAL